jgi:hypothetical protein
MPISCTADSPDEGAESSVDHAPRSGNADPLAAGGDVEPQLERPFSNPWIDAGDMPGPVPLFEAKDDEQGRRFVVGEGEFVSTEDGEVERFPSVMTMTRAVDEAPDDADPPPADDPADAARPSDKIDAELAARIADAESADELFRVLVMVRDGETGVQVELERAMAMGRVRSWDEYEDERDVLIDEQEERIRARTAAAVADIESAGGHVVLRGRGLGWISAQAPASAIDALATREEVTSISSPAHDGQALDVADGEVHQDGAQIRQFVSGSFTGAGPSLGSLSDNLVAAIIELNEDDTTFNTTHAAWKDTDGTTLRYALGAGDNGRWECIDPLAGCDDVPAFSDAPGSHATNIAGIILGDLTNDPPQIPAIAAGDRDRASGFAREALVHMYTAANDDDTVVSAFDHLSTLPANRDFPHVVNNSYRFSEPGGVCEGASPIAQAANRAYVSGVAVFSAAGNEKGSSTDCKVGAPGSAIGSFTVGGHLNNTSGVDAIAIRSGAIYDVPSSTTGSAWGGNSTQGDNRSIVSITAAGPRKAKIMPDGSVSFASSSTGETSFATAVVTATAVDVMDYQMRGGSTWIDSPGQLYANMLLMGDRQASAGYRTNAPDHRWGVGRLRARLLGSAGMDSPWYWYHGGTCIGQGETWDLNLTGGNMPADIDAVKAAAYWYDVRHETNVGAIQVANVNISLRDAGGQVVADQDVYDNKAYVFSPTWPSEPVILRISGFSGIAGHDHPGCGEDHVFVHFAIFAEDSDRESPTYNAGSGVGIASESLEF